MNGEELYGTLKYYAKKRAERLDAELAEIRPGGELPGFLSSSSARASVRHLVPRLLVYSTVYADDWLADRAPSYTPVTLAASPPSPAPAGYRNARSAAVDHLKGMASLAPLIRDGALAILPFARLAEKLEDQTPPGLRESMADDIPDHQVGYVRDLVVARTMARNHESGALTASDLPATPADRAVDFSFADDGPRSRHILSFRIADDQPDHVYYQRALDRRVRERLLALAHQLAIAETLSAFYVTESDLESAVCAMSTDSPPAASEATRAVNFLNCNAPYLRVDSPKLVARVRSRDPELFRRFRLSLLHVSEKLSGLEADEFDRKARELFAAEIEPQIAEIRDSLSKVVTSAAGGTLVASGSVSLALLSNSGLPWAAAAGLGLLGTAGNSLPSVAEYLCKRRTPAFIWHKLARYPRRSP